MQQEQQFQWIRQQQLKLDELTRDLNAHQATGLSYLQSHKHLLEDCEQRLRNLDGMLSAENLEPSVIPVVSDASASLCDIMHKLAQHIPQGTNNFNALPAAVNNSNRSSVTGEGLQHEHWHPIKFHHLA